MRSSRTEMIMVDIPSYDERFNSLMVASDLSDSEGDIEDSEESNDSSEDKDVPSNFVKTTPQLDMITSAGASKLTVTDEKDPFSIWNKLFDEEMLEQILVWTNNKLFNHRRKYTQQKKPELKDVDMTELKAFLGLLLYSAVLKSNHEKPSYLFTRDGTGCEIFRCSMSEYRFIVLLQCLRFDNPDDRIARKRKDSLVVTSFLFNKFVINSQQLYKLSECVTTDKMLVKFRGRSDRITSVPKKSGKLGLVIRTVCDAKNGYFSNGSVYIGENTDDVGLAPQQADKKCSIYSTSRRTRRWSMVVFYRILDLSTMNAFILYNMHQPKFTEIGNFLKALSRSLVLSHVQRRAVCSQLPRELRLIIKRVLGDDMVLEEVQNRDSIRGKRRACSICPTKLRRKTAYSCVGCYKPICLQCSRPLCENCQ